LGRPLPSWLSRGQGRGPRHPGGRVRAGLPAAARLAPLRTPQAPGEDRPLPPDGPARGSQREDRLVPGQLASPYRLSPRLAAARLSSNGHVLGRPQSSTYTHVRLGLRPLSGLVWLAI